MPGRKNPTFTEVELEFMQIIWKTGEVSTDDMQQLLQVRALDGRLKERLAETQAPGKQGAETGLGAFG